MYDSKVVRNIFKFLLDRFQPNLIAIEESKFDYK